MICSLDKAKDLHNSTLEIIKDMKKELKKDNPNDSSESIYKKLDILLEYYNIEPLLSEQYQGNKLYGRKDGPIDVYDIEVIYSNKKAIGYKKTAGNYLFKIVK